MEVELLIPTGVRLPLSMVNTVHECTHPKDIGQVFGRNSKPQKPIYLYLPGGGAVVIAGFGKAEAAELEDIALSQKDHKPFNFEEAREKRGLPPVSKFGELFRDALERKNKRYKQNHRTDPGYHKFPKRVWQGGIDGNP